MGANQSRARTIQDLRGLGFSYRTISDRMHCSYRAISAKRGTALDHKTMGRPKKLTPEIAQFIETVSYVDASLTNLEIIFIVNRICACRPL
jgi:transposase